MVIISIDIAKLRNSEYLQFSKDLLQIIRLNNPIALKASEQFGQFDSSTDGIEALFKAEKGSPLTQDILDRDARRDNAFNGIQLYIESNTYHFDPVIRGHANTLTFHLRNYGTGISRENYQSETAILSNLVADWQNKPQLAAAISALQLDGWVTELNTANVLFNELYIDRTQEFATFSPETLRDKRLEAYQLYYKLRDVIDAWYTINNGAEPWGKTVLECNALIEQYNTLIAGRGSSGGDAPVVVTPVVPPANP